MCPVRLFSSFSFFSGRLFLQFFLLFHHVGVGGLLLLAWSQRDWIAEQLGKLWPKTAGDPPLAPADRFAAETTPFPPNRSSDLRLIPLRGHPYRGIRVHYPN